MKKGIPVEKINRFSILSPPPRSLMVDPLPALFTAPNGVLAKMVVDLLHEKLLGTQTVQGFKMGRGACSMALVREASCGGQMTCPCMNWGNGSLWSARPVGHDIL